MVINLMKDQFKQGDRDQQEAERQAQAFEKQQNMFDQSQKTKAEMAKKRELETKAHLD